MTQRCLTLASPSHILTNNESSEANYNMIWGWAFLTMAIVFLCAGCVC